MQHLEELNSLIDKAAEVAGSDYKLAQTLGVSRQIVSNWRHGHKTATPEDQALLAGIAGLDPVATMARAMVWKHEGTAKGDRLMRVLGKALLATGAAIGSAGASAAAIFGSMPAPTHLGEWVLGLLGTMYII
ncbi:helix-turn-helix domain-containing protein [Paracidovorax citrulli]